MTQSADIAPVSCDVARMANRPHAKSAHGAAHLVRPAMQAINLVELRDSAMWSAEARSHVVVVAPSPEI